MNIAIAGAGYVGLSLAVLLSQHNHVDCITTTASKAEKINSGVSPIRDREIECFLAASREGRIHLDLTATTDAETAYRNLECLRGCEAHSTVILAQVDDDVYRKLGINLTCEPVYMTKKLFHK